MSEVFPNNLYILNPTQQHTTMLKMMERERNAAAGDFLLGIMLGILATLHYYPCACFQKKKKKIS